MLKKLSKTLTQKNVNNLPSFKVQNPGSEISPKTGSSLLHQAELLSRVKIDQIQHSIKQDLT